MPADELRSGNKVMKNYKNRTIIIDIYTCFLI
jgi:hypothetical protein